MNDNILKLNLQFFADGGAEGGTSYGEEAAGENFGDDAGSQLGVNGRDANGNENDREARFEELIKGEFKDVYGKRVQDTVQKRLKGSRETVDKYNALAPTLELLAGKYGTEVGDIDALNAAIQADDSYYEDEAFERGISTEEVRRQHQMLRENKAMKARLEAADRQQKATDTYNAWKQEADELKEFYPDFDLEAEIAPRADGKMNEFADLVQRGYSMKKAYEITHWDQIMPEAMKYAAQRTESAMAKSIMSGGRRPVEANNSGRSPAVIHKDVSKLTDKELDECANYVRNGGHLDFTNS